MDLLQTCPVTVPTLDRIYQYDGVEDLEEYSEDMEDVTEETECTWLDARLSDGAAASTRL